MYNLCHKYSQGLSCAQVGLRPVSGIVHEAAVKPTVLEMFAVIVWSYLIGSQLAGIPRGVGTGGHAHGVSWVVAGYLRSQVLPASCPEVSW